MSFLQIPPNKGSSTYGVQERALPCRAESGQGRGMLRTVIRNMVGGLFVVGGIVGWVFNTFGLASSLVSFPDDLTDVQAAAVKLVVALTGAPWLLYMALVLIGLAILLWHPEKGWRWTFERSSAPDYQLRASTFAPGAEAETDFIPLQEAGRWLYANASDRLKETLKRMEPFDSIADHGAAFYRTQWQEGRCNLYGRWEAGLPMERIDAKDGDFTAFSAVFGSDKRPILDQSIMASDLQPVLDYYEDAVAPPTAASESELKWFAPEEARARFVPAEQAKIDEAVSLWRPLTHVAEEARQASAAEPDNKALLDEFQKLSTQASVAYNGVEKARYEAARALLALLRDGKLIAKGVERISGRAGDEKPIRTVYWNFFSMNLEEATAGGQGHTYLAVRIAKPSRLAEGL